MNDLDIPILKRSYDLYKIFYDYRKLVPKNARFSIYERSENLIVEIVEFLLEAGYSKNDKSLLLEKASVKLNILRFMIRLMKETNIFGTKKYVVLQATVDDLGRQLGGWIRSSNTSK